VSRKCRGSVAPYLQAHPQATLTPHHVPDVHTTATRAWLTRSNTCLPQHVPASTRACHLTHAHPRTAVDVSSGVKDPLSCLFGGRDPIAGVWLRGPGPLRQRQRGSSKTENGVETRERRRCRRVCVLGGQETTDQQRQPVVERPRGRQPLALCSPSWAPQVGRG
jgi:hypothetical protein